MKPSPMVLAFSRHAAVTLALSLPMTFAACSKKAPPVEVQPAPPPSASTPEVTELAPLVEDAGAPETVDAAPLKKVATGGSGFNANQLKIKQCCNAMRTEAKQLGASPEANQLIAFSAQCDLVAAQVGPQGTAPEFNQLRAVLKSLKLPAACQF